MSNDNPVPVPGSGDGVTDPGPDLGSGPGGAAAGGGRVWTFGAGTLRRIVAGQKRATIVGAGQNPGLAVGEQVRAAVRNADGRVPLRLTGVAGPVEAGGGVVRVASAAGLTLADFTVVGSWAAYFENYAALVGDELARGPFWVVSFVVAGEVSGTISDRTNSATTPKKKKKKKKPAASVASTPNPGSEPKPQTGSQIQPKTASNQAPNQAPNQGSKAGSGLSAKSGPSKSGSAGSGQAGWLVVSSSTQLRPNNQLHPEDVEKLSSRIAQVLDRLRPSLTTRQSLARVIGALLEERVCGPDGLPKLVRLRLQGDLGKATAWLAQNRLLTGSAWNPRLLVGLRIYCR